MDSPSLPNRMYTVGWICALPVEMAAATAMLDEVHQDPQELHPNDHNTYTLGKIFNHNVVIACLPAANYGIAPAASTAQQMLTSFTGIRFGLLVGIGGGIPQEGHDIKLGDIVVSEPKGQLGGVVQYDRGKELGVCFERTGWLNSPPEVLLTGVSALKARQWMGKSQIQEHLSSLATKNPSFAHPLLKHDERNAMNTLCEMSTQARSELSYRDMQDPAIHFGLIASGNQVIKDATTRDRLRQELGDVLCFEMEAAGLMNNFPCLVIRGISDYADYQKNDMWQPYASATAAAFAKELLSVVHAHEVEDNIYIASITNSPSTILPFSAVTDGKGFIAEAAAGTCNWLLEDPEYKKWKEKDNGLLWITGKPGSGKSTLLKHATMLESERCSSAPQKIVILSFFFRSNEFGVQATPLDFYRALLHQLVVQYRDQLWNQLVGLVQGFQKTTGHSFNDAEGWNWHANELDRFLQTCIKKARETHIIQIMVDALDECSQDEIISLEAFFKNILSQPASGLLRLSICITCRHFPLVKWQEGKEISIEFKSDADIRTYLRNNLEPFENEQDSQNLENEMVDRSCGIFLWVGLILPNVRLQQRKGLNPDQLLQSLRETPSELNDVFESIIQKLTDDSHDSLWTLRLFQWLCFTRKPLSVLELLWAMNISVNNQCSSLEQCLRSSDSIRTEMQMIKRLKSLSGGLAEVYEHHGTKVVQLIHQSVKEFLIDRGFQLLDPALDSGSLVHDQTNICLSQTCIRYFAMDEVVNWEGNKPWQEFPFLDYAATSWILHAERVKGAHVPQDYILSSFDWPSERIVASWVRASTKAHKSWPVPQTTLLHATARHGLVRTVIAQVWGAPLLYKLLLYLLINNWVVVFPVSVLLRHLLHFLAMANRDIDRKDGYGRTPLSLAAARRHEKVVQMLLLQADVDVNATDNQGRTPLSWAAAAGFQEITELLLVHPGIEVNRSDKLNRTPLMWAAARNNKNVVLRLIQENADVSASDHDGTTALHLASEGGFEDLANILLDHGASIDAKDKHGRTALHVAALYGHVLILQLLLNRGADITVCDNDGDTILHRLAGNKDPRVARQLIGKESDILEMGRLILKHCIDLNFATDFNGRTPLHRAAGNGRRALVELLLQNKAAINAEDLQKQTPLLVAMERREREMITFLVDNGADITVIARQSNDEESLSKRSTGPYRDSMALRKACRAGDEPLVQRLLETDVPVTVGALNAAAEQGHEEIVRMLLKSRPNIARIKLSGERLIYSDNCALHDAAKNGHQSIVKLLLTNGADINADVMGTPFYHAATAFSNAKNGTTTAEAMLQLLLDHGANIQGGTWEPINSVVRCGSKALVQLMLDLGAKPTACTLEVAVRCSNDPVIRLLLERDVEITSQTLSEAVRRWNEPIVRLLVDKGATATEDALNSAVRWGHEPIVRLLLEKGAAVKADVLMNMSKRTNEGIVRLLLNRGAEATSEALKRAAINGNGAIIRLLFEEGADATSETLDTAVENGQDAIFWLLREKGAQITPRTLVKSIVKKNMAIVHFILERKVEIISEALEEAAGHGDKALLQLLLEKGGRMTPEVLTEAIRSGDSDLIRLLLEKGVIITPEAVTQAFQSENETVIFLLLSHGANPMPSALEWVAKKGNEAMVRLLLKRNVPVTLEALDNAILSRNSAMVRLLLDQNPKIIHTDIHSGRDGRKPLHTAIFMGDISTSKLLLERGVNINIVDHYDGTALHIAAQRGDDQFVKLLLQFGANVNMEHRYKRFPLWLAAEFGYHNIVQLLLEHGADANVERYRGKSTKALELAIESDNQRTVQLLLQHGATLGTGTEENKILDLAITHGNKAIIRLVKDFVGDIATREE